MDSSGLLELFRSEMNDIAEPYLWGDDEVVGYIDDAQKMFCRKTYGIPDDSTVEVVQIAVVPGSDRVALHPSIKQIRAAARSDDGRPLDVLSTEEMARRGWYFDGRQGKVRGLVTGASQHQARIYPVSNETINVLLTVYRLPLADIDDTDLPLEIDPQHHRHLLMWVKSLAYGKQDSEAFDKTKSAEFENKFLTYCAEAKEEQRRARYAPRTVAYGGL